METEERDFADVVKQRMREIDEASERLRRKHQGEEPAEAQASAPGAGEPHDGEDASIARWEGDMRRYAEENDGLVPTELSGLFEDRRRQVRLTGADTPEGGNSSAPSGAPSGAPSAVPPDTETLLNGLIEECRSLLRDVAFRSACLTPDADERIRFLTAAQNLATTGANVGKVVARLRAPTAPAPPIEERRQRITVEHVQTVAAPPQGEGGRG